MAEYLLKDLVVEFGGTDISGEYTSWKWGGSAAAPDRVEVSNKSSWSAGYKEYIAGLKDEKKGSATLGAVDTTSRASKVALNVTEGASGSLVMYPEGKTHGLPKYNVATAYVTKKDFSGGYASKAEWSVSFEWFEAITEGTYSSV